MRKPVAAATLAALLTALVAAASPVQAQTTEISFNVAQGTLTITAASSASPATSSLGSAGATATIPLGTTTVKDTRLTATSWSFTTTASDFVTTGGSIGKAAASFSVQSGWSAPAGMTAPAFSTAPSTTPLAADANGRRTLVTTTLGVLNNGLTFTPVLTVNVPAGSPAGTYTGTVTQSVA